MTVFEQELHKLFGNNKVFGETRIVGNNCYGMLTDNIWIKIDFQTDGVADRYDRLKVTLLDRNEGPIDNMVVRFCDSWGRKQVSNPNFKDGIAPHLWSGYGGISWYVYQPTKADYRQLTEAASTYLDVFREPVQEPQMGQKTCWQLLRPISWLEGNEERKRLYGILLLKRCLVRSSTGSMIRLLDF